MTAGQDVLTSLLQSSTRTWQLADGCGASARGTATGAATRRDHAWLALPPRAETPADVALLRFDDRLTPAGGLTVELTPGFILSARREQAPLLGARANSLPLLESFDDQPWPRWRWRGDGWVVERELRMIEGHPALVATWRLIEGDGLRLHVAPLLVARALDGLQVEDASFRGVTAGVPGRVRFASTESHPGLTLWFGGAFMPARAWQRGLAYPLESHDPLDPEAGRLIVGEDAFLPGWVQHVLTPAQPVLHLVASTEEGLFRALSAEQRLGTPPARSLADCIAALDEAARARRDAWNAEAIAGAGHTARQAAQAHAIRRGVAAHEAPAAELRTEDTTVITAITGRLRDALFERADRTAVLTDPTRGLESGPDALRVASALVSVRMFGPARDIARGYLAYLDEGLAPQCFDTQGMPQYESPESSLWLVHLVDLLARRDASSEATQSFLRDGAYRMLEGVIQHLRAGSRHGVRCDREGFLWAGEGLAARSRADLNALWYHALVAMSQLAKQVGRRENAAFYMAWARELQRAYVDRFWDETTGGLYVEYGHTGPTRGIEPSQLWAASLPPMLLPTDLATRLVATVTRELWEPRGLRPRPSEGLADPAWLGTWTAASLRSHGRVAEVEARVHTSLVRWAAEVTGRTAPGLARPDGPVAELPVRGAADLLRAWIEEIDHHASPVQLVRA
jgi:hypothetical protein